MWCVCIQNKIKQVDHDENQSNIMRLGHDCINNDDHDSDGHDDLETKYQ